MSKQSGASKRVLVFAAHPDDDGIGCGGSMIKHIQAGNEVFVIYAGDTGGIDCSFLDPEEYARRQKEETYKAAEVIGLKKENLTLLEHHPWKYSEENLRLEFLAEVRRIKPDICYIPHVRDAHVDHQAVSRAAINAINMAPSPWFRKYGDNDPVPVPKIVLAYEVWTPIEAPVYLEPLSSEVLELKMASLRERKTQEVHKYERAYRGVNTFRAAMNEGPVEEYAEAFQIVKVVGSFFESLF